MLGSRKPVGSTSPVAGGRVTLAILFAIFAVNFMDRQVVAILVEPIKRDLILSDTEIGLLYGFAFAALYTTAGFPIARFAELRIGHGSSTGRSCCSV